MSSQDPSALNPSSSDQRLFHAGSIHRQFAHEIVRRLVGRGYVAYYAGGCVRDALLSMVPKDFDVATNATPDEVREVFGADRTRAVGEAFGVVLVDGRLAKTKCQVEVATFRTDGSYSDGRRPDWVVYATAEQDAQRRDFTINGLFYDPIAQKVIDYVGGQVDLSNRLLRAIGDPYARIREDKLRMLRAIRFASRYAFKLDPATRKAIEESASGIQRVSGERIGMELSKILEHPNRLSAWSELDRCGLLAYIAPELLPVSQSALFLALPNTTLELPVVLASLVHPMGQRSPETPTDDNSQSDSKPQSEVQAWRIALEAIQLRWKLPNATIESARVCVEASCAMANPHRLDWSEVQPKLLHGRIEEALLLAHGLCQLHHWSDCGIQHCKERLAQPTHLWNPTPWIKGSDLIQAGLKPGPAFGKLLSQARAMQLDGVLTTEPMAREWMHAQIRQIQQGQ